MIPTPAPILTQGQLRLLDDAEQVIRTLGRAGARATLGIGKELSRVRDAVGPLAYSWWLAERFRMTARTADGCILMYETWGDDVPEEIEAFTVGALRAVSGDEPGKVAVRERLMEEARKGTRITHEHVRKALRDEDCDEADCDRPLAPRQQRTPTKVAMLVAQLRQFDLVDEPPEDIAELVEPALHSALAAKCYRVAGWLQVFARCIDAIEIAG